jgi:hypothetical protein
LACFCECNRNSRWFVLWQDRPCPAPSQILGASQAVPTNQTTPVLAPFTHLS